MSATSGISVGLSSFSVLIVILINSFLLKDKRDIDTIFFPDSEYDYIVVGAGAAGGPLAARLSTLSDNSVLLIEAGPVPSEHSKIPSLSSFMLNSEVDWSFLTERQENSLFGSYNQQARYPQGRIVGGGTGINNMAYYWPTLRDMDTWADLVNDNRWRPDNLLRYFQDIEDSTNVVNRTRLRGVGGPLSISSLPCDEFEVCRPFLEAVRYRGFPVVDINGGHEFGFMPAQRTIKNGKRYNPVDGFILPALEEKRRLHVLTNSSVEKVEIVGKRATGVTIRIRNQHTITVRARKEVILSAGGVLSPKILQLSGIGPSQWLRKMKIPVVSDLPVGMNFVDHINCDVYYRLDPSRVSPPSGGWDPDLWMNYLKYSSGPLGSSAHRVVGRLPLPSGRPLLLVLRDAGDADARVESFHTNLKLETAERLIPDSGNLTVPKLIMQLMLMQPQSRGTVRLRSTDPEDPPRIDPKYLSNEDDVTDLVDAIRLGHQLMTAPSMLALGAQIHLPVLEECRPPHVPHFLWRPTLDNDNYLQCLVRHLAFAGWHPASSCKMGDPRDPDTVVDSRFRVLGVNGLRVADASVLPRQVSCNPQGPIMGLGNFAAYTIVDEENK